MNGISYSHIAVAYPVNSNVTEGSRFLNNEDSKPTGESKNAQYTMGYGSAHDYMSTRSTSLEGAFFMPYLESGMNVIDIGCGPGSITMGIAQAVAPGQITGIDTEEGQIQQAAKLADTLGIDGATFEVASVYELPYADNTFDAAFSNAVFEHLTEPEKAFLEVKRVLKPGGIFGVRDISMGNHVWFEEPPLDRYFKVFQELYIRNGGKPYIGKALMPMMHSAGFIDLVGSASWDLFGTPDRIRQYTSLHQETLRERMGPQMVQHGIATKEDLREFHDGLEAMKGKPDAFVALCFCEAVGRKPSD